MILSMFDRSGHIKQAFTAKNIKCVTLDLHPGYKHNKTDIVTDVLKWDYLAYSPNHFKFLFIALPCQAYSIASGGFHFKKNIPVTSVAIQQINILIKVYQITKYFNCPFVIENPSGGLINNSFFKSFFNLQVARVSMSSFGYPTQKKTDLFFNFPMLLMSPRSYRCNGRYQVQKLDNMTYNQRVTYPVHFCDYLVQNIVSNVDLGVMS